MTALNGLPGYTRWLITC